MSSARVLALLGSTALLVALVVACGGTTSSPSDVTADGGTTADGAAPGSDASTDASTPAVPDAATKDAAGGCAELPAEGTSCAPGQVSCDRVDLCCASAAQCDPTTSTWKLSGNACLLCPTHGCGDKTCTGTQMCVAHAAGIPGGSTTYECAAYPAACAREWTCACVEKNLPGGCTLAANGCNDTELPVKVSCMGI